LISPSTDIGIDVTLDNSGAAGGSHDTDTFQGHRHGPPPGESAYFTPGTQGFSGAVSRFEDTATTTGDPVTDTVNGPPRIHDQTQPISSAVYYYYKA